MLSAKANGSERRSDNLTNKRFLAAATSWSLNSILNILRFSQPGWKQIYWEKINSEAKSVILFGLRADVCVLGCLSSLLISSILQ